MSKIKEYVRHLAVVAAATLLAQCAWAIGVNETGSLSNLDATFSAVDGASNVNVCKLTIPATDDLPAGTKVKITSIRLGTRAQGRQYLVLADGGAPNDVKNAAAMTRESYAENAATVAKADGTSATVGLTVYNSANGVEVTVGQDVPCYLRDAATGGANNNTDTLYLVKPRVVQGVQHSNYPEYSLIYEINYTVTSLPDVVTATLNAGAANLSEIVWSETPSADKLLELTLTQDTVLTIDALPEMLAFAVKKDSSVEGTVLLKIIAKANIVNANLGAGVTYTDFEIPSDASDTIKAMNLPVPEGKTLTIIGSEDAENPLELTGQLQVAGTLKTKGYVKLSYGTVGTAAGNTVSGTMEVVSGTTEIKFADRGLAGTLTIDAGATLKPFGYVDACKYDGSSTVNVYGTLAMTDAWARWTLRSNNVMNFFTGSKTIGDGQEGNNTGAIQFNTTDCVLHFKKSGTEAGTVQFDPLLHAQQAFTIDVDEGVTVTMANGMGTSKEPATFTGAGKTVMSGSYAFDKPITVSSGATLEFTSTGSVANGAKGEGNVIFNATAVSLGTSYREPTLTFAAASAITATASDEEMADGAIVLKTAMSSIDGLTFTVGETAIESEDVVFDAEAGTITLKLVTQSIKATSNVSDWNSAWTGTVSVKNDDPENAITLTVDAAFPAEVNTVNVFGKVAIVYTASASTEQSVAISLQPGAEVSVSGAIVNAISVLSGASLTTLDEVSSVGTITNAGTLTIGTMTSGTINNTGTLNVTGDSTFKLANTGTVNLVSGVSTISADAQTIKGTINIAYGAMYKSANNDQVPYGGSVTTTINVRGTLDMGTTRWTVGGADTINLYGGCTVSGQGDSAGLFDLYHDGNVINVLAGEGDQASETTVTIPAPIRARNTNGNISIAQGMKLALTGGIKNADVSGATINMNGAGRLTGTIPLKGGFILNLGTSVGTIDAKFVAESGDTALKLGESDGYTDITTTDTAEEPIVWVKAGATLQLYVKDFSSWTGASTEHAWVKNEGTLNILENGGSRYFRGHLVMKPGTTTTLAGTSQNFIVYGGNSDQAKAQMIVPASEEAATATFAGEGTIQLNVNGSGGTAGSAWDIGANSTLDVQTKVIGGEALVKYGAGTLKLSNAENTYNGTVTLNAGTIKSATTLTVSAPEGYTLNTDTESEEGMTIYTLTRNAAGTVYATTNTCTTFALADGTAVTLVDGDAIVLDSDHITGNAVWGLNVTSVSGHDVTLSFNEANLKGGIPENMNLEITKGKIYLYSNIGAGAAIMGEGAIELTRNASGSATDGSINDGASIACAVGILSASTITINGDVTISGTIICDGTIKLADTSATLTCAVLAEGKVISGVEDYEAKYSEGKYTLVEVVPEPTEVVIVPGGEEPFESKEAAEAAALTATVAVPEGIEEYVDAYKAMFVAKVTAKGEGWVVTMELKESVVADVKEVLDAPASSAQILNPTDGAITITAKPGLWYGIKAGATLDSLKGDNAVDSWTMATGTTVEIDVPEIEDADSTFYTLECSAVAPEGEEAE